VDIIGKSFSKDNNMLIYCGAVIYKDNLVDEDYNDDIRQIDLVIKELGTTLRMATARFTSLESKQARINIKNAFINQDLQALVAIKCLDEGVNIPAIKTAFILASSSNPREYVQRRGRVLRKFEGKSKSIIFDFVTLASPLEEVRFLDKKSKKTEEILAQKELIRIKDFSLISLNPSNSNVIINSIESSFGLDIIQIDEDEWGYYE
jgi:superfamily II DNA or RNA helicase